MARLVLFLAEAIVVVRDSQRHAITEALGGLQVDYGVRLKFVICDIPDQEDWGTADSLRHIRSKIKVGCSYRGFAMGVLFPRF